MIPYFLSLTPSTHYLSKFNVCNPSDSSTMLVHHQKPVHILLNHTFSYYENVRITFPVLDLHELIYYLF